MISYFYRHYNKLKVYMAIFFRKNIFCCKKYICNFKFTYKGGLVSEKDFYKGGKRNNDYKQKNEI